MFQDAAVQRVEPFLKELQFRVQLLQDVRDLAGDLDETIDPVTECPILTTYLVPITRAESAPAVLSTYLAQYADLIAAYNTMRTRLNAFSLETEATAQELANEYSGMGQGYTRKTGAPCDVDTCVEVRARNPKVYNAAIMPQIYEFFATETDSLFTLPGLFDNYEPRGVATLGAFVLLSLKGTGANAPRPSLFVLMQADAIKGIFRLLTADGRPFNGSVTSVAVAQDVAWTVDGAMRPYVGHPAAQPNDLVVGYAVAALTPTAAPRDLRPTASYATGVRPAAFLHFDPDEERLWVGATWTRKTEAEASRARGGGDGPFPGNRCHNLQRYNIHGRKQQVTRCPEEVDMSEADQKEAAADETEAAREAAEKKQEEPVLGALPTRIVTLSEQIETNTGRVPPLQDVLTEMDGKVMEVSADIYAKQEEWVATAANYDQSIKVHPPPPREERIWAPEVFIVGEGIHFTVDDSVRLMAQLNHANIIAAELGLKTYEH